MTRARGRWPGSVYTVGSEPDPRFTFANERTLLAWIRTSLALLAAGVALAALRTPLSPPIRRIVVLLLLLLACATSIHSWFAWARAERCLRRSQPLPAPALAAPVALGVAGASALLLIGVLVL